MPEKSTIQLEKRTIERLQSSKTHPKESYNDVVTRLLDQHMKLKQNNQYDEFLHKIQQAKMQELWDNREDEFWETV